MGRQSEGVALSIAQARTAGLAEGKTYALSLGFGGFEGKGSAGLGGTARLSDRIFLSGGLGVGLSSGVVGGGAAVSFQW
jgi:hypothetical protein